MISNPHIKKAFEERDEKIKELEKRLAKLEKTKSTKEATKDKNGEVNAENKS